MDITLPTIPAGVLVLLGIVSPWAQALLQRFIDVSPLLKKTISVALSLLLTAIVLAFYYVYTGDVVPEWPVLVLLTIVVAQASYALIARDAGAKAIEQRE
jgi:uncharacterized BrkB/YihY/UPF0761 family membrane protein